MTSPTELLLHGDGDVSQICCQLDPQLCSMQVQHYPVRILQADSADASDDGTACTEGSVGTRKVLWSVQIVGTAR